MVIHEFGTVLVKVMSKIFMLVLLQTVTLKCVTDGVKLCMLCVIDTEVIFDENLQDH